MSHPQRKVAFVIAGTDHGPMIVNRFDYHMLGPGEGFGVGYQILERSSYSPTDVHLLLALLEQRKEYFGETVTAVDCGANIGVHSIEWARRMSGWGSVIAIEAQERIFYALAGNIAINNCFNIRAILGVASASCGITRIPVPNYLMASSFGSLEVRARAVPEFIGQPIDYSESQTAEIASLSLDSLRLPRIDLIKLDVEGMEIEVLDGAEKSIETSHPILFVEFIKSDKLMLDERLSAWGYVVFVVGDNFLAVHATDPCLKHTYQLLT